MKKHRASKLLELVLAGSVSAAFLFLVAGLAGKIHPAFDALSHFRAHASVGMAVLAVALLPILRWKALLALAFASVMLGSTFLYRSADAASASGGQLSLIQANVRFDNQDLDSLITLLREKTPDIVTLQEVTPLAAEELNQLRDLFPYQHICTTERIVGGSAVLSQHPWVTDHQNTCQENAMLAIAAVQLGSIQVDVVAVHLHWPWPYRQSAQIARLKPFLETLGDNAIIAGDFNATPWSAAVRNVASYSQATVYSPGPTWLQPALPENWRPVLGLPIDHVLIKGVQATGPAIRLGHVGSDHLPVMLNIEIPQRSRN